ncbi:phosphonate ABC transporter, permease protein PhnE [Microbulbifer pacificus]|uniref:Phosphonate ABC transporter, permease protein PhnE n=1 Tax=Microbulbifer pacificus TaxID=407164 RepID=A0AAU0MYI8_9GAMM|nr:phosphonate ABC transporter, permease protein PhnE [Microbulbifer pacificus]WOX04962.1 phosphonate ABC transporter, permease protein PhnE [Microbulbifer pacificus]
MSAKNAGLKPAVITGNLFVLLLLVLISIAAFRYLALDFSGLLEADTLRHMGAYLLEFLPPDYSSDHLIAVGRGALETLAMSVAGTLLAAITGLLLALPAAGNLGKVAKYLARGLLNMLRAIPELVWAALMVLAAGLGPNAGTLALALHTTGVLGRLFAEALENTPPDPAQAIRLAGGSGLGAFCYGTLPLLWPQLTAYTLYRWENNIRMSSVLGFVGAGGLGQMLYIHLSLFQQPQAATVLIAMLLMVFAVDGFSHWLRRR